MHRKDMGRNQRKHVRQCVNEPVDSGRCWFRKDDYCSVGIDEYRVCRVSGAMMVPTEVLAKQQYESICSMFEKHQIPLKVVLLMGSMTAAQKRAVYEQIRTHEADIVVGTHAVIQEKAVYDKLALVITDEQHRFGVNQRQALSMKGTIRTCWL